MASNNRIPSPSQSDQVDLISAFEGVLSNQDAEKQTERLIRIYQTGKRDVYGGICVLHDDSRWTLAANEAYSWYKGKSLPCQIVSYFKSNWLDDVKSFQYTHFVFFGYPPFDCGKKRINFRRAVKSPIDSNQQEMDYFAPSNNRPLNSVVVILPEKISSKKDFRQRMPGHYLDKYLKLDGTKRPSVLAASALGVFAAPKPQPQENDKVYWSDTPKLVEDFRISSNVSLGLTIMTREMAEGAPFPRIVLINSFSSDYRYDFYSNVARYTHIQSINGILLDGLTIEKVTDIFKKLPDHHVQMLIRYIHTSTGKDEQKDQTSDVGTPHPPLTGLPNRLSIMTISEGNPNQPPTSRSKLTAEKDNSRPPTAATTSESSMLPLPLFILGDNRSLCKQLFNLLSDDTSPPLINPSSLSQRNGSLPVSPQHPANNYIRSQSVPSNHFTTLSDKSSCSSLENIKETEDTVSSLFTTPQPKDEKNVRRRSRSFKGISSSDKYIHRAEVPLSNFESLPQTKDVDLPMVTSPTNPANFPNQECQQQFILHMPSQDLDRLMTHLYFKSSGIYMIVVGLEDFIENPLCQYENLFYWINLIHTYVSPEVQRMFVVGMYRRSTVTESDVLDSVRILNDILGGYRQCARNPHIEQGYVYLFDIENSLPECQHLCSYILNCTKLFSTSSFFFVKEFYNCIFTPFKEFQRIASDIGLNHDRALLESKFAMGQRFNSLFGKQHHIHLPSGYYETLAAYSNACISKHCEGCLLIPSIIPDLISYCAQLDKFSTQVFDDPVLRKLPLVSINMLRYGFLQLHPNNVKDFEMIIWWMEHLSIIYTVGKLHRDEKFFVPFLLHYHLSDRQFYEWDEAEISDTFKNTTVLYAQFSSNVPMTIHLFHKIIADLLKSVLKDDSRCKCYLDPDSPQVVLPLHDDNDDFISNVLIKYHFIQNIIEFQANVNNRIKFLHVVESKLSKAYLGSNYYNKTIDVNRVVSFRIPAKELMKNSTHPNVWELAQLKSSLDDIGDYLIPTSHLTEPGNRRKTAMLKKWAEKDPEAKELPSDLYVDISRRLFLNDNWIQFVSKLNLMTPEEIQLLKQRQGGNDPGAVVLQKWRDSSYGLNDLIETLRSLRLDNLADKLLEVMNTDEESSTPFSYHSKILEKKLPVELFIKLSLALNQGDKWARLGDYLNFFTVPEIENLRQKPLVDKGQHVLQLWTDSHLTYQDLINGLRSSDVRLDLYVPQIDDIIKSHNAQFT